MVGFLIQFQQERGEKLDELCVRNCFVIEYYIYGSNIIVFIRIYYKYYFLFSRINRIVNLLGEEGIRSYLVIFRDLQ